MEFWNKSFEIPPKVGAPLVCIPSHILNVYERRKKAVQTQCKWNFHFSAPKMCAVQIWPEWPIYSCTLNTLAIEVSGKIRKVKNAFFIINYSFIVCRTWPWILHFAPVIMSAIKVINKLRYYQVLLCLNRNFSPPVGFFLAPAEGWRALRAHRWFWRTDKRDGRTDRRRTS